MVKDDEKKYRMLFDAAPAHIQEKITSLNDNTWRDSANYGSKIYIDSASYELFKPQIGDVIRDGANVAIIGSDHHEYSYGDYISMKDYEKKWKDSEIIQRDEIAFFTPEFE